MGKYVLSRLPEERRGLLPWFVAVGVNAETAHAAGTPVLAYQIWSYAAGGVCYAIAGVILAGFVGYASPTGGNDYLLPSITVVVVGGTPFSGGRGSLVATGAAALFITMLSQMVLSMGAGAAEQLLAQAAAIVVAMSMQRLPGLTGLSGIRARRGKPV